MIRASTVGVAIALFVAVTVLPSSASCVPPSIGFAAAEAETLRVAPGDSVSLFGEGWTSDCFDTGPTGACQRGPGDERPMRGIDVDVIRGGRVVSRVAEDVTANDDLTLSVAFPVPDLEPGRYRILVHDRGARAYPGLSLIVD